MSRSYKFIHILFNYQHNFKSSENKIVVCSYFRKRPYRPPLNKGNPKNWEKFPNKHPQFYEADEWGLK